MNPTSVARSGPSRATTVVLLASTGVLYGGVSLVFPLLAEFQDTFGFSTAGLGLVSGTAFLAALVAGLFLAGLADRGHLRALMVGGAVLAGASVLWFAVGTELWQFVGARALEGLGLGVFTPAVRKVMTSGDPSGAGHQLGRLTSAELGGFLLGPTIGTLLAEAVSLDAPFLLLAALSAVVAAVLAVVPLPAVPTSSGGNPATASLRLARRPHVLGAALLSLALFLPVGLYDALWARYLTDRGASTVFIGVSLSLYSLPIVLFAPLGGRLADRVGPVRAASLAMLVIVPVSAVYGLVPWLPLIVLLALTEAVPQAVASPAVQSAMVRAAGPSEVAAGQGLINSLNQLGAALVALAAPVGYAAFGPGPLFALAALTMASVFLAGLALVRRYPVDRTPGDTPDGTAAGAAGPGAAAEGDVVVPPVVP